MKLATQVSYTPDIYTASHWQLEQFAAGMKMLQLTQISESYLESGRVLENMDMNKGLQPIN